MELDSTPSTGGEDTSNPLSTNTRCTFCFPCFGSRRSSTVGLSWWERVRSPSSSETHPITAGRRWFMKVREWSELVAGPRWKTFIRRFNRNRSGGFRHAGKYQYDPLSYALNFDEGPSQHGDFEDDAPDGFRNFSVRYAAAPPPPKSVSTDLGQDVVVSG